MRRGIKGRSETISFKRFKTEVVKQVSGSGTISHLLNGFRGSTSGFTISVHLYRSDDCDATLEGTFQFLINRSLR
jgi:hypothetical protein